MLRSTFSKLRCPPKLKCPKILSRNLLTLTSESDLVWKYERPKLLVGDGAGTFFNSLSDAPIIAFEELADDEGVKLPRNVITKGMGSGKWDHLFELRSSPQWVEKQGPATKDNVNKLYKKFNPKMVKVLSVYNNVKPIDGTEDTLHRLKNDYKMTIGLTTGYDEEQLAQAIKTLKLHGARLPSLIDYMIPVNRPHPDGIEKIMKWSGVRDRSLVWKLDDTGKGIEEGKNAKCGATLGLYGECSEMGNHTDNPAKLKKENPIAYQRAVDASIKSLHGATFIIPTIKYIPALIDLYCRSSLRQTYTSYGEGSSLVISKI